MLTSALFLFLTLIVYTCDPDLHQPLFGKITIGFLINNILAFVFNAAIYLSRQVEDVIPVGSFACVALGYLMLYTFFSFMLWINSMAGSIFFKFSSLVSPSTDMDTPKIYIYIIYAQVRIQTFASHD